MSSKQTFVRATRVLAGLALVAGIAAPGAQGAPGKTYKTVLTPQSVPVGSTSAVTATVTNLSEPQGVGSVDLTVPSGWALTGSPTSSKGTAALAGSVVQLRNLALMPGQSATVTMPTAVPCGASTGTYSAAAKQSNNFNGAGNDVTLDAGASDLVVGVSGSCSIRFATQPPADVGAGDPFTTAVELLGGDGQRFSGASRTVSLQGVGATLNGPSTATTTNGLATFSGLSLTAPDLSTASLSASSPGFGSATSSPTTVHGDVVACDPNVECTASETFHYTYEGKQLKASFTIKALADPDASRLVIDQYLVPNPTTADAGCEGDDLPQPVIARFIGANRRLQFVQTVDGQLPRSASLGDVLAYGGPLKPCLTLPYQFSGSTPAGTIDGKPAWRGLARSCSFLGLIPFTSEPCLVSQGRTADGDYAMTVALRDDPLDPYSR